MSNEGIYSEYQDADLHEPVENTSRARRQRRHPRPEYIKRIRRWIKHCNILHHDTCVPDLVSARPLEDIPVWLIDTHDHCIVSGSLADRYLALSYVWPETRGFSDETAETYQPRTLLLNNTTVADFQMPGFLDDERVLQQLPMVIRFAMQLTRHIKERYLWVDRLCIVQDDPGEAGTLSQVAKMDKIYGGAYLTIIAAAPNEMYSSDELLDWPAFIERPNYDKGLSAMKELYGALAHSHWSTRGWTYQEQILCRRAVVFLDCGVFWDCRCAVWDDACLFPAEEIVLKRADMGKRFSERWWPDFGFYIDLVCPYNGRNFSYPQDAALGIMGILNALGATFLDGFVHGLPRLFLDHALLWQPFGIATRRYDKIKQDCFEPSLPSWSWLGWHGFVDPWSLRSGLSYSHSEEYQRRARSWRTNSLVQWHFSSNHRMAEVVLEPRIFETYSECLIDDNLLPQGWRSWKRDQYGLVDTVYTHESDHDIEFKHPIPLTQDPTVRILVDTPAYLSCSATTVSFQPAALLKCRRGSIAYGRGPAKISAFEDSIFKHGPDLKSACPVLVLQQPNGAFAGLLRLMNNDEINGNSSCELIAISTGSAEATDLSQSFEWRVLTTGCDSYDTPIGFKDFTYNARWLSDTGRFAMLINIWRAFSEIGASREPLGPELGAMAEEIEQKRHELHGRSVVHNFYLTREVIQRVWTKPEVSDDADTFLCEFYNVLWIERKEGVAYRRACGWVPKLIWEAHCTGPVDVKLG